MLTYIIPTRDRAEDLSLTLAALGRLDHSAAEELFGGVEAIVVDNASRFVPQVPPALPNGVRVRPLFRATNEGAAARNVAAQSASGRGANPRHWLVMLDDDSAPLDTGFFEALASAPDDVAAIGAEVFLQPPTFAESQRHGVTDPRGRAHMLGDTISGMLTPARREAGGLPEVFIGCGVAIRRSVFLELGGYDAAFGYYAEEYDLAARMMLAGYRVTWDRRFRVHHRKVAEGRDLNTIIRHLVRNNVCVTQRYAPESVCIEEIDATIERYHAIAKKEHALHGFDEGLMDLQAVISSQPRWEMPADLWDRFSGQAAARSWLTRQARRGLTRVSLHEPVSAKGPSLVRRAAEEAGMEVVEGGRGAQATLIATLSPGPMLDAADGLSQSQHLPVLTPWGFGSEAPAALLLDAA
jgi:GT2 family glycosyltransferase